MKRLALALLLAAALLPATSASASPSCATFTHQGHRTGPDWWTTTRAAGRNDCAGQWLVVTFTVDENSVSDCCELLTVAPGGRFKWNTKQLQALGYFGHVKNGIDTGLYPGPVCQDGQWQEDWVVSGKGTVGQAPDCP